jgi:hypothetical protein
MHQRAYEQFDLRLERLTGGDGARLPDQMTGEGDPR